MSESINHLDQFRCDRFQPVLKHKALAKEPEGSPDLLFGDIDKHIEDFEKKEKIQKSLGNVSLKRSQETSSKRPFKKCRSQNVSTADVSSQPQSSKNLSCFPKQSYSNGRQGLQKWGTRKNLFK